MKTYISFIALGASLGAVFGGKIGCIVGLLIGSVFYASYNRIKKPLHTENQKAKSEKPNDAPKLSPN